MISIYFDIIRLTYTDQKKYISENIKSISDSKNKHVSYYFRV